MDNKFHTNLIVSSSPHIVTESDTTRLMGTVLLALAPAWIASIYIFGIRAPFFLNRPSHVLAHGVHAQVVLRRARHEHRILDGQTVPIGEPFEVDGYKIRYPGDPTAEGFLIWNCRCTTIAQLKGFERDVTDLGLRHDDNIEGMSYDEWKEARSVYEPITRQEEISEAMRERTIREDYNRRRRRRG